MWRTYMMKHMQECMTSVYAVQVFQIYHLPENWQSFRAATISQRNRLRNFCVDVSYLLLLLLLSYLKKKIWAGTHRFNNTTRMRTAVWHSRRRRFRRVEADAAATAAAAAEYEWWRNMLRRPKASKVWEHFRAVTSYLQYMILNSSVTHKLQLWAAYEQQVIYNVNISKTINQIKVTHCALLLFLSYSLGKK